jgi:glycogen operon protein
MLLGGDELGRTQRGNNNAYCQDNEISWYDWEHADGPLLEFVGAIIKFRHKHAVFRRRRWFQGRAIRGSEVSDIGWFTPGGQEMSENDWRQGFAKSLGVFLNGQGIPTSNDRGERVVDDSFYVLFNAHSDAIDFELPDGAWGQTWSIVLDTAELAPPDDRRTDRVYDSAQKVRVEPWSIAVLKRVA